MTAAGAECETTSTELQSVSNEEDDVLLKPPIAKRERKVSPSLNLNEVLDPMSPSSSSSASKDETFEPSIEMMVNDFDDEQTLNEEESLAALESHDVQEEIDTLKQESEIPLEELLAKYQSLPPPHYEPHRKKSKKSSKKKHKSKSKNGDGLHEEPTANNECTEMPTEDDIMVEQNEEERETIDEDHLEDEGEEDPLEETNKTMGNIEVPVVRRTHLLELYPEGTFSNVAATVNGKDLPLETLFGVEEEEVEEEDDEEYKKKVMIGSSYQAFIPKGLSQYGDILPYENEDKLIWEPSQVTEREVEAYLIKIRDINRNQGGEDESSDSFEAMSTTNKENEESARNHDNMENNSFLANGEKKINQLTGNTEDVPGAVVKDNEQALHLLVQCGYDFKEALRRKRLNALPMNDGMSLWSEEECQKFEEGIQKFGKDFVKIRQHQVRTRTMRELVQFYYLWKKSERRDHNFANTDTVDHMDIYLNEDNEYGSNPASITPVGSPANNATTTRKNSQKNISIMANTSTTANLDKTGPHKKRSNNNVTCSDNVTNDNINNSSSVSTIISHPK
ncbi:mesoderm induction early response protein 1 [Haematobia irritans]|uniref:mesoderm induction early response protein 1 n=1 Tax=Haematobia irritans TaxID=7368 RepID=UPI003F4F73C3